MVYFCFFLYYDVWTLAIFWKFWTNQSTCESQFFSWRPVLVRRRSITRESSTDVWHQKVLSLLSLSCSWCVCWEMDSFEDESDASCHCNMTMVTIEILCEAPCCSSWWWSLLQWLPLWPFQVFFLSAWSRFKQILSTTDQALVGRSVWGAAHVSILPGCLQHLLAESHRPNPGEHHFVVRCHIFLVAMGCCGHFCCHFQCVWIGCGSDRNPMMSKSARSGWLLPSASPFSAGWLPQVFRWFIFGIWLFTRQRIRMWLLKF